MANKLGLFNGALRCLGERKLASLTENREPRRLLDDVYADQGIERCLQQGQWNFAMRTVKLAYSPSVEPDFGYNRAFDKPTDWQRTAGLCCDEFFKSPLLDYNDEAGFWFASIDTIYVRYVSSDAQYGGDLALWPANFTAFVESWFALQICDSLTQGESKHQSLETLTERLLRKAKASDAMDEATAFPPPGTWVKARAGYRSRRDRGTRSQLIG